MFRADAIEANGIIQRLLINLSGIIGDVDATTSIQAKVIIGWTAANAPALLYYDQLGPPLDTCFDFVRQSGCTLPQMDGIRILLDAEMPVSVGATMTRDRSILFALAQEGKIISSMTFTSRQDVDDLLYQIQVPFNTAEEVAADTMDQTDYQAITGLRAAIVNFLVSTARPLPYMLSYQFAKPLPSIVISYRLYGDASRYDEIRQENYVVHPAFCPPTGQALSS